MMLAYFNKLLLLIRQVIISRSRVTFNDNK